MLQIIKRLEDKLFSSKKTAITFKSWKVMLEVAVKSQKSVAM